KVSEKEMAMTVAKFQGLEGLRNSGCEVAFLAGGAGVSGAAAGVSALSRGVAGASAGTVMGHSLATSQWSETRRGLRNSLVAELLKRVPFGGENVAAPPPRVFRAHKE